MPGKHAERKWDDRPACRPRIERPRDGRIVAAPDESPDVIDGDQGDDKKNKADRDWVECHRYFAILASRAARAASDIATVASSRAAFFMPADLPKIFSKFELALVSRRNCKSCTNSKITSLGGTGPLAGHSSWSRRIMASVQTFLISVAGTKPSEVSMREGSGGAAVLFEVCNPSFVLIKSP